jgi:oligopeptide transport system permease protein
MLRYTLKRFGIMLLTIWIIVTITFFIMHLMPGDPFTSEKRIQPEILENMMAKYGLDKPLIVQYGTYLKQLVQLDLGDSFKYRGRSVNTILQTSFKVSGSLGIYAITLGAVLGIGFGIIAALNRGKFFDYFVIILAVLGVSVPNFVFATMFQYFLGFKLGELFKAWFGLYSGPFPIALWGTPAHYVLPVMALGAGYIAYIARMMRTSMLDVINQDYIRTAKAKGLSKRTVIWKHAIRNAILPIVTILGVAIAGVVVGSLVIENIFAIPGMGKYFVQSIMEHDYMMIMGTTIFYAVILIIMMFLIDVLYGVVDPRIRLD